MPVASKPTGPVILVLLRPTMIEYS